jgi:hypothetical protein
VELVGPGELAEEPEVCGAVELFFPHPLMRMSKPKAIAANEKRLSIKKLRKTCGRI